MAAMRSLSLVFIVITFYGIFHRSLIYGCFCINVDELAFALTANGASKKNDKESLLPWEHRLLIAIDTASALAVTLPADDDQVSVDSIDDALAITDNIAGTLAATLPAADDDQISVDIIENALAITRPIDDGSSQVSADIASTSGYIDPKYCATRSHGIYGFGVGLMEIITGKPMFQIGEDGQYGLLPHWVSSMFAEGEVGSIVDPKLQGEFDIYSVEEALKIAVACVSKNSADQPTMDQVIRKLNHCLQIERARLIDRDMPFVSLTSIEINVNETNE